METAMKTPSTRSKSKTTKLKTTPDPEPREGPSTTANTSKKLSKRRKMFEDISRPERENTTGLAIFPDELLLEILSYYPDSNDLQKGFDWTDGDAHFARRERLIALSQTCRNLHRFFHPYIWSRIEVFKGMRTFDGQVVNTNKRLALELIRQLEVVTIRDPTLANYVKIVNVKIGSCCMKNVIRELARCLTIFPNVHTLRLDVSQGVINWDKVIRGAFGDDAYFPQIRSMTIHRCCDALLRYCPKADVHIMQMWLSRGRRVVASKYITGLDRDRQFKS